MIERPYYAVIFSSRRTEDDAGGYAATAALMTELARQQPGFLGIESVRDADGFGITVSYWRDETAIRAWKTQIDHQLAQQKGRQMWYEQYDVRVAKVERSYGFKQNGEDVKNL